MFSDIYFHYDMHVKERNFWTKRWANFNQQSWGRNKKIITVFQFGMKNLAYFIHELQKGEKMLMYRFKLK